MGASVKAVDQFRIWSNAKIVSKSESTVVVTSSLESRMGSGNLRLFRNTRCNTARNAYSSVFLPKEGKIKYKCVGCFHYDHNSFLIVLDCVLIANNLFFPSESKLEKAISRRSS